MRPRFRVRLTLLFLLGVLGISTALHAETATVTVAGTSIKIPAPAGFFRFDGKSARVDQIQKSLIAEDNLLLAAYCSEDDLAQTLTNRFPELERNFTVQTFKKPKPGAVTSPRFRELKTGLRTQLDTAVETLGEDISKIENSAGTTLSKELESKVNFKVGELIQLGVFDETDESISFSFLGKTEFTAAEPGANKEFVCIIGASILNIQGRLLFLYCTSGYGDKSDIEWARNSVKAWRDQIISANQLSAIITRMPDSARPAHTSRPQAIEKAESSKGSSDGATIAIILCSLVLLLYLTRRWVLTFPSMLRMHPIAADSDSRPPSVPNSPDEPPPLDIKPAEEDTDLENPAPRNFSVSIWSLASRVEAISMPLGLVGFLRRAWTGKAELWKVWWLLGGSLKIFSFILLKVAESSAQAGKNAGTKNPIIEAEYLTFGLYATWCYLVWVCAPNVKNPQWKTVSRVLVFLGFFAGLNAITKI